MKLEGLEEKNYPYLQYPLYKGTLTNGLTVYLLARPDFHETYGLISSQFGAADTIFKPKGQKDFVAYPAGIAHFLEHKLFETDEGGDVLQEFSKLGASANAYTSLSQTNYLFSATEEVLPALALLQGFVREASFTEESVERERAIIGQEIEMYQDDPDSRLYNEILASLYPKSPLQDDIAGSIQSIDAISVESLYENFETFYQAQNMTLLVLGNFDLEQVWHQIQSYQAAQVDFPFPIERQPLFHEPVLEHGTAYLEVASPKLALGLRGDIRLGGENLYRYRVCLSLFFSMMFGWTSKRYQDLYESGKIDSSLYFQLELRPDYHFFILTVDTNEPILVSNVLRKALLNLEKDPELTEEHLQLVKKEAYGHFIRGLNSLDFIASQFILYASDTETMFDLPSLLDSLDFEEVVAAGRDFISHCDMTDFTIFPK